MLRLAVALACLFVLSLSGAGVAVSGAWTLERGETKAFVTSSFTYGDHGFDDDGELIQVPEYQKFTLDAALEYGLRPWLTAIVRAELLEERTYGLIWRDTSEDIFFRDGSAVDSFVYGEETNSTGAVAGGARVRFIHGDHYVASVQGLAATGSIDSAGNGVPWNGPYVEARALAGISGAIAGRHTFFDAQAGYRFRLESDDVDEVVFDLTVGAQVLPRWMILGQTFSTLEVDGETHFTKGSASIVYTLNDHLQLHAGALGTLFGRNAVRELGGQVGFWWTR